MPSTAHESIMFKDLLGSDEMRAIFSDGSTISAYLEVERALAKVQAKLDIHRGRRRHHRTRAPSEHRP